LVFITQGWNDFLARVFLSPDWQDYACEAYEQTMPMREQKILCTIAHEIFEAELMSTGLPYHIAHMYAMEVEKGIYHVQTL